MQKMRSGANAQIKKTKRRKCGENIENIDRTFCFFDSHNWIWVFDSGLKPGAGL